MPTKIDHYSLALVDNLETDIGEVKFSNNLRIVRLDLIAEPRAEKLLGEETFKMAKQIATEGPLKDGYRMASYRSSLTHSTVVRAAELSNHALEWRFTGEIADPFNENYDRDGPTKLFSDVITSLRLLKEGLVGRFTANQIIDGDPSGLEGPWSKGEALFYQPSLMNIHNKYVLNKDEVEKLTEMFRKVSDCKNLQVLIALGRFNRQYAREEDIDRLIDIMVGFEALYLKGVGSELEFRLAARTAGHLGEDSNQKKQIYNCLLYAYRLRSAIVHGSARELRGHKLLHKGGWNTPYAMLEQLSSLLRKAICSILLDVGEKRFGLNFHQKLDEALIMGKDFAA